MALHENALVSVEEVLRYMQDEHSKPEDDYYLLIEDLINSVSSFFESYTNGPIINQTFTEHLSGNGKNEIFLSYFPTISVISVFEGNKEITDKIDFYEDGVLFFLNGQIFPRGRKITVNYEAGYGSDRNSIPWDLKYAAMATISHIIKSDVKEYSKTFGEPKSVDWYTRLPHQVRTVMDYYRRKKIGVF